MSAPPAIEGVYGGECPGSGFGQRGLIRSQAPLPESWPFNVYHQSAFWEHVVRTRGLALDEVRNGHRRRAVVADEDPTMLWLLRRALADDFDVSVAENGQRAVELARTTAPDIVLLDLGTPVLDGFNACRQIRAFSSRLPIVLLSGHADEASVRDAFAAGATDFLVKPFSPSQLRARLRACVLRVE